MARRFWCVALSGAFTFNEGCSDAQSNTMACAARPRHTSRIRSGAVTLYRMMFSLHWLKEHLRKRMGCCSNSCDSAIGRWCRGQADPSSPDLHQG